MSTLLTPDTLAHLQSWQGRSESLHDLITPAPLRALSATLDRDDAEPVAGTELPPLWHWLFFLPHHRQSEIGPDGHAKRGGFLPPVPLPRRMWAGGRLHWHAPLRVGDEVRRVSTIESVTHKAGRTGDLLFVLVKHEVHNAHGLCLTEEHDIVYRPAAQSGDAAPAPLSAAQQVQPGAVWQREVVPDDVLLFRYSALTFNGHRIHYDRQYVTQVEGYPGLVVHGPLIATLLVDLVRRHSDRPMKRFEFKALRPTFECADQRHLRVSGQPDASGQHIRLWAQDYAGWLTMQASAELV
ncbi:MaoC family dehydratase N-terminal domain-containing protein [Limnohabitans sp. JirII-31]|uniref:FAS1-like dehydratase domain-containing protein n=1 Tax=Limnohabitans sp. JirII-31 TaxID=1977908 RepID=UPI000C1F1771|nr:MaoC family dehydratase N-terminal domain-containing protein [Limnohabitans sp. JirII-31]PIT79577.1 acyl-CoA dehydrogenase [Limnohabitans sp. JirII-31]